jgi:hypothetical protein
MAAGTDPAAPEVQPLTKGWMELAEAFDGGDAGLRESNARLFRERSVGIASQGGTSPAMIDMSAAQTGPALSGETSYPLVMVMRTGFGRAGQACHDRAPSTAGARVWRCQHGPCP